MPNHSNMAASKKCLLTSTTVQVPHFLHFIPQLSAIISFIPMTFSHFLSSLSIYTFYYYIFILHERDYSLSVPLIMPLNMILSISIHVASNCTILSFLIFQWYSIVYNYNIIFYLVICSYILGCFPIFAIVNSAVVNTGLFWIEFLGTRE